MSQDLALYPITDLVEELKRRECSFLIAWCDHQQFSKSGDDIVWAIDRAGNLPLQLTLLRLLNDHLDQIVEARLQSTENNDA